VSPRLQDHSFNTKDVISDREEYFKLEVCEAALEQVQWAALNKKGVVEVLSTQDMGSGVARGSTLSCG